MLYVCCLSPRYLSRIGSTTPRSVGVLALPNCNYISITSLLDHVITIFDLKFARCLPLTSAPRLSAVAPFLRGRTETRTGCYWLSLTIMSRPVTFEAAKMDDGALSVGPSSGETVKPASVAEITREGLPVVPGPGSLSGCGPEGHDVVARETPTEDHCDDPSGRNGVAPLEKEADVREGDDVLAAAAPVPVPKHQGLPSFAQSEFYTVDMIILLFFLFFAFLSSPCRLFVVNVASVAGTASR